MHSSSDNMKNINQFNDQQMPSYPQSNYNNKSIPLNNPNGNSKTSLQGEYLQVKMPNSINNRNKANIAKINLNNLEPSNGINIKNLENNYSNNLNSNNNQENIFKDINYDSDFNALSINKKNSNTSLSVNSKRKIEESLNLLKQGTDTNDILQRNKNRIYETNKEHEENKSRLEQSESDIINRSNILTNDMQELKYHLLNKENQESEGKPQSLLDQIRNKNKKRMEEMNYNYNSNFNSSSVTSQDNRTNNKDSNDNSKDNIKGLNQFTDIDEIEEFVDENDSQNKDKKEILDENEDEKLIEKASELLNENDMNEEIKSSKENLDLSNNNSVKYLSNEDTKDNTKIIHSLNDIKHLSKENQINILFQNIQDLQNQLKDMKNKYDSLKKEYDKLKKNKMKFINKDDDLINSNKKINKEKKQKSKSVKDIKKQSNKLNDEKDENIINTINDIKGINNNYVEKKPKKEEGDKVMNILNRLTGNPNTEFERSDAYLKILKYINADGEENKQTNSNQGERKINNKFIAKFDIKKLIRHPNDEDIYGYFNYYRKNDSRILNCPACKLGINNTNRRYSPLMFSPNKEKYLNRVYKSMSMVQVDDDDE